MNAPQPQQGQFLPGMIYPTQPLPANTTYLVFVTLINWWRLAFLPLVPGTVQHGPSTTAGNEGVEVYIDPSSVVHDDHSLVGMVRTDTAGMFVDEPKRRWVRSWFNRRRIAMRGDDLNTGTTALGLGNQQPAMGEVLTGKRIGWLNWADEVISLQFYGVFSSDAASQTGWYFTGIGLDDTTNQTPENLEFHIWPGFRQGRTCACVLTPPEGLHEGLPLFSAWNAGLWVMPVNSGQATARARIEGMIG